MAMIRVTPYMHTIHHMSLFIPRKILHNYAIYIPRCWKKNDNAKGQFFQTSNKLDAARDDEKTGTTKPREGEAKV